MANTVYSSDSPYYATDINDRGGYLDVLRYRKIPVRSDDVLHTLTKTHALRPDLLAHDLYGNSNLWWVFIARNPNAFEDPVFDFTVGKKFYIPKKATIERALGI